MQKNEFFLILSPVLCHGAPPSLSSCNFLPIVCGALEEMQIDCPYDMQMQARMQIN